MRRNMKALRVKVDAEQCCRSCGTTVGLETAHVIPRSQVGASSDSLLNVIPLCGAQQCDCHGQYDGHRLDLLSLLTVEEQANAVLLAGGLERARRRLLPSEYRPGRPAL